MSNFFENQIKAKKRTKLLVLLYLLAVAFIIIGVYLACVFLFGIQQAKTGSTGSSGIWHPEMFTGISLILLTVIFLNTIFKISQLGSGGAKVARLLGGRLISVDTTNLAERKLLNVVEETAIAAGMKVPPIYLLEEQKSINAFAAGTSPGNAVIGVSRGSLELLTRDELQGVVAHEFSHILNGDMALNIRLIGILHGILFIALTGRILLRTRSRGRSSKEGGGAVLFGMALLVIGYTGVFFATLIKMAVSRQREFLADASAVQFTRYPEGIAGALQKIGVLHYGSKINHPKAEEASHMFFADGMRKKFSTMFSTHPPLDIRIKAINPKFNGIFTHRTYDQILAEVRALSEGNSASAKRPKAKTQKGPLDPLLKNPLLKNPLGEILGTIGTIGTANIAAASALVASIPEDVRSAIRSQDRVAATVYMLLLDENINVREVQLDLLRNKLSNSEYETFLKVYDHYDEIAEEDCLSILDLALPSLSQLGQADYNRLRQTVYELAHADNRIDLYEYVMQVVLRRHYYQHFSSGIINKISNKSMKQLVVPAEQMILALAMHSHPNDLARAKQAYLAGIEHCGIPAEHLTSFDSKPYMDLKILDHALKAFKNVRYEVREIMLRSAIAAVSADEAINTHEFALIRAIADSFDCPVPLLR